jgi:prepilin-type processing-associated H-X9-DG protein
VELLTVIAVIAILAGLLFPVLAHARRKAWQSTCLSNLRQIATAHQLYMQDWDERFPDWWQPGGGSSSSLYHYWPELLQPYGLCREILRDPSFTGPVWAAHGERVADYVLPTWGPSGRGTAQQPYFRWPGPALTLAEVTRSAETVKLLDGWTATLFSHVEHAPRHAEGVNVAFVDGHARWISLGALWAVRWDDRGFHWFQYASADR